MNEEDATLLKPEFWAALGIRSVRTFAQSLGGSLGVGTLIFQIEWKVSLGIAVGAMLCAILTGVAWPKALPEIKPRPAAD